MQRLIRTCIVILISAAAAFTQTISDPIQVGYAVVTPSFPTTNAMVVFGSFTRVRIQDTLEANVFPPNLSINALVPVEVSSILGENVGIAIVNPNNALVTVTMTLRRSDGTPFSSTTITISGHRQISKLVTELFPAAVPGGFSTQVGIPAEFSGTLLLASSGPVSILGFRLRGAVFSILPVTDLSTNINPLPAITSGVGGLGAVLLPQFVVGDSWGTEVEIVNLTATSLTVRLDVFTPDGNPLSVKLNGTTASTFTNLLIPANGLLRLKP